MSNLSAIEVWYHDALVGRLALTPYKPSVCAFEYSPAWLQEGFSISPFELPLEPGLKVAEYHPFEGNFGVFNDCLPDGWGNLIIHRYLQSKGINSANLNILEWLCLVGTNGRGALEFRPDRSLRQNQEFVDFERLSAESAAILDSDTYTGEMLEQFVQRGGSPGGARPKIFLQADGKEWLVKFCAKSDDKKVGRREYEYSLLAKRCGIVMPQTRLFDDCWFATERFDRKEGKKVHVISAGGLLRADYQLPSIDYWHLFALTSKLTHSMEEMWQLYRLMVFNVLIGNRDDHAKNFSFLYDEGWHLAPAYDLLPCGIKGDYHTTSVNDNPDPKKEDIFALAQRVSLPEKEAKKNYAEIEGLITSGSSSPFAKV